MYSKSFSLVKITEGRIELIGRNFPSRASSHKNIDFDRNSSNKSIELPRIQIAIARSKLGHFFLMSAGARFTVILVPGN